MISHRARRPDRWLSALLVPVVTAMVMALCACPAVAATDWAQADVDLYVGDFNGDNKDDMLYIARSPDRASGIALSSQGSDGVWRPAAGHQSWASGYLGIPWFGNYYRPVIGDFNGDGKDDILMQRRTPGDHFLLLADGTGKFTAIAQTIAEVSLGMAWSEAAHRLIAGDFDGDGRTDLFLQGLERNSTHAIFQPTGEIFRILAHTKIVQAGVRVAEQVAGKAARGIGSLDALSRAAGALDRGGISAAGRQLQKHGSRPGSAFPGARGNPSAINQQGQQIVDDILTTPGTTTVSRHHARFGDVTEIRAPDGRGLRYGSDGRFLGFLEPRP
ncbi:MAG: FG-GAP repeat domain-containing protein, partial [Gammaproteobacteria bacterium]